MRIRHTAGLLLAATFLFIPSAAQASSVAIEDGVLVYRAAPGEANAVNIGVATNGEYDVYDGAAGVQTPSGDPPIGVQAGNGCREKNEFGAAAGFYCQAPPNGVRVELNDRDDTFCFGEEIPVPITARGGRGFDEAGPCGSKTPSLEIDADDVADDGPSGRDNFHSDIEGLFGSLENADKLGASDDGGRLRGRGGNDTLRGGRGDDVMVVAAVEDVGEDLGTFYPSGTDTVTCGGGVDLVLADKTDTVARDCETIGLPAGFDKKRGQNTYEFTGSRHANVIEPPYGWVPNTVNAGAGNDRIRNGIDVNAGAGNDTVYPPQFDTAQAVSGGAGNDKIDVRDEQPQYKTSRDTVKCGSGKDKVYANKADKVARDCEKVKRVS